MPKLVDPVTGMPLARGIMQRDGECSGLSLDISLDISEHGLHLEHGAHLAFVCLPSGSLPPKMRDRRLDMLV